MASQRNSAQGQSAFAQALFDPASPPPGDIAPTAGAPSVKRFNVYRNNVIVSLTSAVAQAFPALRRLIGDARFASMARSFVQKHPPRNPIMLGYGEALPGFLEAEFEPAKEMPFLADIARLELARRQSYNAEDAEPLTAERFQAFIAEQTAEAVVAARFAMHPAARIIRSDWPVFSLWRLLQERDGDDALLDQLRPSAESVLVLRPALTLSMRSASPSSAAFLTALAVNASIGEAIESIGDDPDFDLSTTLGVALGEGAFAGVRLD